MEKLSSYLTLPSSGANMSVFDVGLNYDLLGQRCFELWDTVADRPVSLYSFRYFCSTKSAVVMFFK